jgi:3-oxoacyl-[acyl-carrier protein] reductase
MDEAFFDMQFNVNVKAPLFLAKAVAPLLPNRMQTKHNVE